MLLHQRLPRLQGTAAPAGPQQKILAKTVIGPLVQGFFGGKQCLFRRFALPQRQPDGSGRICGVGGRLRELV